MTERKHRLDRLDDRLYELGEELHHHIRKGFVFYDRDTGKPSNPDALETDMEWWRPEYKRIRAAIDEAQQDLDAYFEEHRPRDQ